MGRKNRPRTEKRAGEVPKNSKYNGRPNRLNGTAAQTPIPDSVPESTAPGERALLKVSRIEFRMGRAFLKTPDGRSVFMSLRFFSKHGGGTTPIAVGDTVDGEIVWNPERQGFRISRIISISN